MESRPPCGGRALDTVREFNRFNRLQAKKPKNPEDSASYKARMTMAESLLRIFRSSKVLQPMTKYRLKVGRLQIDGDYAILRDSVSHDPMILQLRVDEIVRVPGSDLDLAPQNLISYARHWRLLTAHDYRDASVLNLHVPSGKTWIHWLPLHHSQKFVKAAVEAYQLKLQFPSPGAHCATCLSQACLNEAIV